MMDWATAGVVLGSVVVGALIQEFRIWRERKDKYKDMVFEKRLDAHQEGYYRIMKLLYVMMPHMFMRDGGSEVALKKTEETMEWRDKNALYLNEDSTEKIDDFLEYVADTGRKYVDEKERKNINIEEETRKLLRNVGIVSASIKKGIGVKYLPEKEILGVRIGEWKSLDERVREITELMKEQMK